MRIPLRPVWRPVVAAVACTLGLVTAVVAVMDSGEDSARAEVVFQGPGPRTMLVQASSGKCADAGAGTDGTRVTLRTCKADAVSQWWDEPGDGTFRSAATGLCLDVAGANTANGTRVQTAWCTENAAQRWTFQSGFRMSSRLADGKCLDIAAQYGENPPEGTELAILWCDGKATAARANLKQGWGRRTNGAPGNQPAPQQAAQQQPAPAATGKKGVGLNDFNGVAQALRDSRSAWYFNWSPEKGAAGASGVEFAPMIWDERAVNAATLDRAKANGRNLLGFNEPDRGDQAAMSVGQALDLWPQLQNTGMRLGSPAVATGAEVPGGWLDQFMSGARTRGLRVDFIAVHWYGSDFSAAATGHLKNYLDAVYNRYRLPIWLTEYALISWPNGVPTYPSRQQQVDFIKASTTMLNGLPYLERYGWFILRSATDGDTGLYRDGAVATTNGTTFRAIG